MNRSREIIKNHLMFKQVYRYYGAVREETYYDVLGISKDASKQDIRLAYLKLSKEKHPDKNFQQSKESHTHFVKINEAYNVLSKTDLKAQYDDKLKYGYGNSNRVRVYRTSSSPGSEDFNMYDTYYNTTIHANRRNVRYKYKYGNRFGREFTKTQLVFLCIFIWIFGNVFHVWAVMKSPTFNRKALLERSQKFSAEEKKVRQRAHENGKMYNDNAAIALALLAGLEKDDDLKDDDKTILSDDL
ncbi:dnaJ homolog subfamily C member 4-like [Chelonus insularis]|uniref:dnaJ homolog subfamily C member 4-like n=1 Tax=Chelonus insularis TaxID=460826 RepID=UPI0015897042|nr:dnaJ homolog subfamily C member 4-like [Chelonus insularis]